VFVDDSTRRGVCTFVKASQLLSRKHTGGGGIARGLHSSFGTTRQLASETRTYHEAEEIPRPTEPEHLAYFIKDKAIHQGRNLRARSEFTWKKNVSYIHSLHSSMLSPVKALRNQS